MIKLKQPPVSYKILFSIASLLGFIFFLQSYAQYAMLSPEYPYSWDFSLPSAFADMLLWAAVSPLIVTITSSFLHSANKRTKLSILKHILYTILFCAVFSITARAIVHSVVYVFRGDWFPLFEGHSIQGTVVDLFSTSLIYWIIAGAFFAVDYYKQFHTQQMKLSQMQNELTNAQLNALKMQLNPHFLFNTLNTISSLMGKNDQGQKVLSRLGLLLRSMLEQDKRQTIPLNDEINYVNGYLYIEEVRFQDRLTVSIDIETGLETALVPNLILQPLVENAIKHGFSKKTDSGTISISAKKEAEKLILVVSDDGHGASQSLPHEGIGVANVRERLKQLYNGNAVMTIKTSPDQGYKTTLEFPLRFGETNE